MILVVDYDALYREQLRRLLAGGVGRSVRCVNDPEHADELLTDDVDLMISRVYFPDPVGNRDYEYAAKLFHRARKRIGDLLPIIGLTTNPVDDRSAGQMVEQYGFPGNVHLFDIVATRPKRLVELATELLPEPEPEPAAEPNPQ